MSRTSVEKIDSAFFLFSGSFCGVFPCSIPISRASSAFASETETLKLHQELDHISRGFTSETMKEFFVWDDLERRRLLVLKRT